jgi:hypothetical protein
VPEQNRGPLDCIDDRTNVLDAAGQAVLLRVATFPDAPSMGNDDSIVIGEPRNHRLPILWGGSTMEEN